MKPLTPPDADLQDFPFMPLHVARLRDSDLAAEGNPEGCWYAVLLWSAAWHQLPAGSLPNTETVLARLCGLGRDVKTFTKHRDDALRGWTVCEDGRLYHPVVAEQVIASWRGKVEQRHRSECARIKKANQRNETDLPTPRFEESLSSTYPASVPYLSLGTTAHVPRDMDQDVPRDKSPPVPGEIASKGKRQGEGKGQGDYNKKDSVADATGGEPPPKPDLPPIAVSADAHLWEAGKRFLASRGVANGTAGSLIGKWKGAHGTAATIEALGVAQVEPNLVDPIPFIEAVLRRRSGGGGYSIDGTPMNSPC